MKNGNSVCFPTLFLDAKPIYGEENISGIITTFVQKVGSFSLYFKMGWIQSCSINCSENGVKNIQTTGYNDAHMPTVVLFWTDPELYI